MDILLTPIPEFDGEIYRQWLSALIRHHHERGFPPVLNLFYRQVGIAIIIEPALPEPVQVLTRPRIHTAEEIQRHRMLAMPVPDIPVQTFPEQAIAQQIHRIEITHRRLCIRIEKIGSSALLR